MDDTRKFVKTELHDPDALLFLLSHDGVDAVTKAALKAYRRLRTNGNAVRVDYDVSKAQRGTGFGRLYAEGASLQSFSRDVRGALAGKLYLEVDAVNAHPTMLERLCETRGWHHTALRRYVGEREALLVSVSALYGCSRSIAKELFLTLSFGGALGHWPGGAPLTASRTAAQATPTPALRAPSSLRTPRRWWTRRGPASTPARCRPMPGRASGPCD